MAMFGLCVILCSGLLFGRHGSILEVEDEVLKLEVWYCASEGSERVVQIPGNENEEALTRRLKRVEVGVEKRGRDGG